ncbi:choline ABC transporter ATP-binding protein [Vibrio sp. 10N.286.49.C2]|uniref:choline ABC transporter ATP-binding protein n=1 Tax=unclassified Vibrio TaxID=2614977 RepID=UPI000C81C814|nr:MULTISPECIES: choline ABC transporter ATP-binding protein [unclassified Vibrio]PMH39331.1 choline ABC transporter ATP-binding protein [Vibrio sp. 10N.286.49.C2]PMH54319.1 choline ABC transporter ATP-binding protein [Vibrio sp. 10N.286.49.B1]PMH79430.1 choline ABC transporter ATP-binding protein [Vibrio sp. 10N.286.48.B7]
MSAISIRHLDVVFGRQVEASFSMLDDGKSRQDIIDATGDIVGVHDVSLDIQRGEICVLMGLSGSGKSSLLRAINGLNTVSRGSLKIEDEGQTIDLGNCDAGQLRHLRTNRISMVFQKFALMPWLSVLDNAAFGLKMQGIGKTERRRRAEERLEMVGLAEWKDSFPHELSGGMQQRVGLARAFTMDSDILLMDEPFSALDPLIRSQLQDELLALQQKLNKTIVFVSHDLDEALKLGNNIAIMESGRLIQHGKPEDIVLNPNTEYVAEFVAHTNPLNVLCGRSLMTEADTLSSENGQLVLNQHEQTYIGTNDAGQVTSVTRQGKSLPLQQWQEGDCFETLQQDNQVITSPDVSMREGLEIRYRTGQPVLLAEDGELVGVLADNDFYHALLGKHFTPPITA